MKGSVFWDRTLCSPLNVELHFGGTYRQHLQGQIRKQYTSVTALLATCFHAGILLNSFISEDGGDMFVSLSMNREALYPRSQNSL
jgi:hypothetical protein